MRKSVQEALSLEYNENMYRRKPIFSFCKRLFDIISSGLAIIIFSWLFIILAILVKCSSKGPVFYGHTRVGKNGKNIKIWKFRSMRPDNRPLEEILTPEQLEEWKRDYKITNDPRVTKIGKFLRKTSLDELPQLFNIFGGSISVVGYRPVVRQELLEKYTEEEQKLLLKTKPGLTGLWASHGRSNTTYEDRVKMELYYCYKRGWFMDIRILWHTVIGVFKRDGAK